MRGAHVVAARREGAGGAGLERLAVPAERLRDADRCAVHMEDPILCGDDVAGHAGDDFHEGCAGGVGATAVPAEGDVGAALGWRALVDQEGAVRETGGRVEADGAVCVEPRGGEQQGEIHDAPARQVLVEALPERFVVETVRPAPTQEEVAHRVPYSPSRRRTSGVRSGRRCAGPMTAPRARTRQRHSPGSD